MVKYYSIHKWYPFSLTKTVGHIGRMSRHKSQPKISKLCELIILFCPEEYTLHNYNEICSRLVNDTKIVVVIKKNNKNIFTNIGIFESFIITTINDIIKDFIITHDTNLTITKTTLICHGTSAQNVIKLGIYDTKIINQIILIDPIVKSLSLKIMSFSKTNLNIPVILTNNYLGKKYNIGVIIDCISGNNVYQLKNVASSDVCNMCILNLHDMSPNVFKWNQLVKLITDIMDG